MGNGNRFKQKVNYRLWPTLGRVDKGIGRKRQNIQWNEIIIID